MLFFAVWLQIGTAILFWVTSYHSQRAKWKGKPNFFFFFGSEFNGLGLPYGSHWLRNWKITSDREKKKKVENYQKYVFKSISSLHWEFNWLSGPASLSWNASYLLRFGLHRKQEKEKQLIQTIDVKFRSTMKKR